MFCLFGKIFGDSDSVRCSGESEAVDGFVSVILPFDGLIYIDIDVWVLNTVHAHLFLTMSFVLDNVFIEEISNKDNV